jgi:hypothetical protein
MWEGRRVRGGAARMARLWLASRPCTAIAYRQGGQPRTPGKAARAHQRGLFPAPPSPGAPTAHGQREGRAALSSDARRVRPVTWWLHAQLVIAESQSDVNTTHA